MLNQLRSKLELYKIPVIFFFILLIHGATLGLSDDEAYYWVLSQKPALSYGFHPPAVAWMIYLSEKCLGWIFGSHSVIPVRFPAVLSISCVLGLVLKWFVDLGFPRRKINRAVCVLLSFVGLFGLSWLMVPDIPLFLGWTLSFVSTWKIAFGKPRPIDYFFLIIASVLMILSKYSGVFAVGSSLLCLLIWAPTKYKKHGLAAVVLGASLGTIPILIWNAQHEWGSILYQIRDRHSGEAVSWVRWLKFWIVEAVFAGPVLVGFSFILIQKAIRSRSSSENHFDKRIMRYLALWAIPPGIVFCVQPLFANFKPHWAFIVWWPVVIGLAWVSQSSQVFWKRWISWQIGYGLTFVGMILISGHIPWVSWVSRAVSSQSFDPKWDVTHDLYGWSGLAARMKNQLGLKAFELPVVGSRYQTAAQAAFQLSSLTPVTLIPRDLKERDEWPNLNVSEHQGPEWPKLTHSVYYLSETRYSEPPQFPGAVCSRLERFTTYRFDIEAKWIDLWRCDPSS